MKYLKSLTNKSNIVYGNLQPHDEAKINVNERITSYFIKTGLMKKYEDMSHPDDEHTLKELMYLKNIMQNASEDDLKFALDAAVDESEMYRKFANSLQIKLPEEFTVKILKQIEPLLFYLKKYHNRARPSQFATKYNIPFQTKLVFAGIHPAYPSGHALDSYIMKYFLTMLSPENSEKIHCFCTNMMNSRLEVGLHYPSDNIISEKLAQDIINHRQIQLPGA